jgi:hypothetical protein
VIIDKEAGLQVTLREDGVSRTDNKCTVRSIANGQVHLVGQDRIPDFAHVTVAFKRITLQGTVISSRPSAREFLTLIQITPADQVRREPRFPLDEPCVVYVLAHGPHGVLNGRLCNFSRSGLGLQTEGYIEGGNMVCVETRSLVIAGEVRRCQPTTSGTITLGIETTDILADLRGTDRLPVSYRLRRWLAEWILGRFMRV